MRILHSSDWHLGKKLEGYSRIKEQRLFIDNLVKIADGEEVDMIVVAGDIYDVSNPPIEAEKLFYNGVKRLSNNGKRPVIIIPGNHDNPEKLSNINPLASEDGIIIFEKPFEKKEVGKYGEFDITSSTYGGIEIKINDNKKAFVYALPYPGEKALGEVFHRDDNSDKVTYSERIQEILREGISQKPKDIPGIIITHIFLTGSIYDEDERPIELGGSLAVNINNLPETDYIALGHIHKPIVYKSKRAVYSGSPIEYRVSENKFEKQVFIADLNGNLDTDIRGIKVENYKPIKKYQVDSIEEAIKKSKELSENTSEEWVYLEIKSNRPLQNNEVREIKKNKDIIEIIPIISWGDLEDLEVEEYTMENIDTAFKKFYKKKNNIDPSTEIVNIFNNLLGEV